MMAAVRVVTRLREAAVVVPAVQVAAARAGAQVVAARAAPRAQPRPRTDRSQFVDWRERHRQRGCGPPVGDCVRRTAQLPRIICAPFENDAPRALTPASSDAACW
jgi:hypothetical protein